MKLRALLVLLCLASSCAAIHFERGRMLLALSEPTLDQTPERECGCLQWTQADGGYICVRPYCPLPRKP